MWQDIYDFLERFSGVSYDFQEDLDNISGYKAFIEPYEWHSGIMLILENLEEALDIVDEFGDELYEDLPNKRDLKKIIATYVLSKLIKNINDIKKVLNIEPTDICNFDDLENQIGILGALIDMLISNSLDDILKHDLFDKYEEDSDGGGFVDILGIHKNDMASLSFIVTSIREDYFASLDEDEE